MMRFGTVTLLLLVITLGLNGCDKDRYELKEDKKGRTIRLDKQTGEVAILENDKLVTLKSSADQEAERVAASTLSMPKTWPAIKIEQIGRLTATLKTSWREGQCYYRFALGPAEEGFVIEPDGSTKSPVQGQPLKPVTDPDLIAKLEESAKQKSRLQKGTSKAIEDALLKNFTLLLYDQAGFKILEIPFLKLMREVDEKGRIISLIANDSTACSAENYKSVSYWNLQWTP